MIEIDKLKKIREIINGDVMIIPYVLSLCSEVMTSFKEKSEKKNNALQYEALGDALHLLGQKRKPNKEMIKKMSPRIVESHFRDGIQPHHHEGEKQFYRRFIEDKECEK